MALLYLHRYACSITILWTRDGKIKRHISGISNTHQSPCAWGKCLHYQSYTHAYPSWAALLILQTESLRRFGNLCRQWMCVWQADQRRKTGTLCLLTGESDFLKSEIQESWQWRRGVIVTVPCLTSQHSSPISLQAIQTSRYQCLFQDFYYIIIMTDYYPAWL